LHVEAAEVVTRLLGIVDVLKHHVRRAARLLVGTAAEDRGLRAGVLITGRGPVGRTTACSSLLCAATCGWRQARACALRCCCLLPLTLLLPATAAAACHRRCCCHRPLACWAWAAGVLAAAGCGAAARAGRNRGVHPRRSCSHSDLPDRAVAAEDLVHLLRADVERQVAHVQDPGVARVGGWGRRARPTGPAAARGAWLCKQAGRRAASGATGLHCCVLVVARLHSCWGMAHAQQHSPLNAAALRPASAHLFTSGGRRVALRAAAAAMAPFRPHTTPGEARKAWSGRPAAAPDRSVLFRSHSKLV
jgi:hypothetical protein